MPKGLAFLSKKSFHTAKLCNQEKVWIAEKEKEAEDAKIRELSRQIQQEREEEDLQRISGNKTKRLDRGIDWMYQGGQSSGAGGGAMTAFEEEQKKKEAEEYLLGKEYNPSNLKSGDFAEAATGSSLGVNKIITAAAETVPVETQNSTSNNISAEQEWNTNFHLRYEDPMFMVEQRRKEKERDRQKKKQLFEEANDDYYGSRGRERKKENRDGDNYERKRSRKETNRPKSRRKRSYSSESSEGSRRHGQKRDRKRESRHRYHTRSSSRSRSRSPYRKRSYRHRRSRSRSYDYKRSCSSDRRTRKLHRHEYRDQKEYSSSSSKAERNEKHMDSHRGGETKQYGLIGASLSKPSDIGPDISLIAKKKKEKEEARSRYRRSHQFDDREKRKLTDEERAIALAEMQQNAKERVSIITSNETTSKSKNSDLYDEEIQRRMEEKSSSAHRNFLEDATARAHAIDGSHGASLSSRLAATRHRHQRDDVT